MDMSHRCPHDFDPVSVAMKQLLPLDGMLVNCRVTPALIFVYGTHLYTWVERDNVE